MSNTNDVNTGRDRLGGTALADGGNAAIRWLPLVDERYAAYHTLGEPAPSHGTRDPRPRLELIRAKGITASGGKHVRQSDHTVAGLTGAFPDMTAGSIR